MKVTYTVKNTTSKSIYFYRTNTYGHDPFTANIKCGNSYFIGSDEYNTEIMPAEYIKEVKSGKVSYTNVGNKDVYYVGYDSKDFVQRKDVKSSFSIGIDYAGDKPFEIDYSKADLKSKRVKKILKKGETVT